MAALDSSQRDKMLREGQHLVAPQVQLIHEEGQVVEAELCVVAHK